MIYNTDMDSVTTVITDVKPQDTTALEFLQANPKYKLSVKSISILMLRGYTQAAISRLFGVSEAAVSQYITRHYSELAPLIDKSGDLLSLEFKSLANKIVQSVKDVDIKRANLRDRIVSAGIALDKSQILQGLPSAITACITISAEEALALRSRSAEDAERIIRAGDIAPDTHKIQE